MSILVKKLGGIDIIAGNDTIVITTVGGFDKYLNPISQNMIVGDIAKIFVKNKITEWQTFKNVYYENKKLKPKYYDKLMDVMNNIFAMPIHTESDKDLVYMITTMYNSSNEEFFNGLNKNLNLYTSFKLTLRYLFMTWKMYLEKLIEIFVKIREQYIKTHIEPKNKENNFLKLTNQWIEIDIENHTNTSSPILFFNFPPKKVNLEKSIPKIEWYINGAPISITNAIDTFLKAIKQIDFIYCGFCIHNVIERFKLLISFPFVELINAINAIDINQKYNIINKQLKKIIKKIMSLKTQVCDIKNIKLPNIIKNKVPQAKNFPKNPEDKINFYEKYINAYLNVYQQMLPSLSKKEKLICELSLKINIIAADIIQITNTYDKTLLEKI
jgi:hypothetical protein